MMTCDKMLPEKGKIKFFKQNFVVSVFFSHLNFFGDHFV
jgi:hypothetical protein